IVANEASHVGATGRSAQASHSCVLAAVRKLQEISHSGRIALDTLGLVLQEYQRARMSYGGQPGVGDAFFKWVHENQANPKFCDLVEIHATSGSNDDFEEVPTDVDLRRFDRSDRKFVAIVIGFRPKIAVVLNAVDSDWWNSRDALRRNGIEVEFVCPNHFQEN
ncbi:MAG: hypothetical protein ACKN81_13060, partial [Pirellulaceae bacterium]